MGNDASLYEVGDVIDTWVYRTGFFQQQFSLATAVGLFKGVIGLALVYFANRVTRRLTDSGAVVTERRSRDAARRTRIRTSAASRAFDWANYAFLALLGLLTVGPFLYLIFGSLTETDYYRRSGSRSSPAHWTLDSYQLLLGPGSRVYQALKVTGFITVGRHAPQPARPPPGSPTASRRRTCRAATCWSSSSSSRCMFGGGHGALLPGRQGARPDQQPLGADPARSWSTPGTRCIMMKFFESLPTELEDAARLDGCSELGIFGGS